jgi:hypothetical protein
LKEAIPIQCQHAGDGTKLDDDSKGFGKLIGLYTQNGLGDDHVTGAGNGQKLGNALNNGNDDRF